MKKDKFLKGASAFLIATMASMGLVNAEDTNTCNGTLTTDYYLFLEAETIDIASGFVNGTNTKVTYNTDKKNLQKQYKEISSGPVTIQSTKSGSAWSVDEFYSYLNDAYTKGTGSIYSSNNTNYIAHSTYYDIIDHTVKESSSTVFTDIYSSSSGLTGLKNNTVLPSTTFNVPDTLGNSSEDTLTWGVTRDYDGITLPSGLSIEVGEATYNYVFAPAAYYVTYCVGSNKVETYTIKYDANGGSNAPAAQTANTGTCETISQDKPTLNKNNFLGWSTDSKATEPDKNYAPGSSYCEDKDITLYAVWQTQTGIADYGLVAGFIGIITIGGLFLVRNKNIFKQI